MRLPLFGLVCVLLVGCGGGTVVNVITPTPTPSPNPTPIPSPSPTPLNYLDVWEPVAIGISDTQAAPTGLTPCPATLTAKDGRTVTCASGDYIDTRENVTAEEVRGGVKFTGLLGMSKFGGSLRYNLGGVAYKDQWDSVYSDDYQTWTATYVDVATGFKTVKQWRRKK